MAALPRVLVASPVTDRIGYKSYCLDEYFKALKGLTYGNRHTWVLLESSLENKKRFLGHASKSVEITRMPDAPNEVERMVAARNEFRKRALEGGYDYMLFLEQDIVPPMDLVERLLAADKEICSALYFNIKREGNRMLCYDGHNPMAWDAIHDCAGKSREKSLGFERLFPSALLRVDGCGLGCVLIGRKVLEKVGFRCVPGSTDFEEFFFAEDCRKHGFEMFVDSSTVCRHHTRRGCEIES